MSENLGKIVNYAGSHGAMVIFINQLREKIGVFFGNPETTPGGRSLKHNCSVRIQISKKGGKEADIFIENEEGNESLIGRYARVNVRKNRMAKPYMESILVPVYYEAYFPDIEEMLFDVGRQLKLISVRKGVFKWEDSKGKEHKLDGRRAFIDYIKSNKLEFLLANSLIAKAAEVGVFLPPEITQWYMNNTKAEEGIGSDEKTSNKEGSASGRRKGKSSKVGDGDSQ